MTAALALAAPATVNAGFKEPVKVIWQHTGSAGNYFGWAVSPLADVNHDGAADAIIGEPGFDQGTTWLLSGATGAVIRRFDGRPGDANGYAIADAGDTDRDGVHDIISGAPRQTPDAVGHAYLYSGRNGSLLHAFTGEATGDSFGSAVSSAGDVDRDGRPDLLIGAAAHTGGDYAAGDNGPASGFAGVYSGRDGTLLHSWLGSEPGAGLGPGRGAGDVDRDHRPDLAIGSYQSNDGAPAAGKIELYSGATGARLRTITSTTAGENLGFDEVGVGDVNRDHRPDLLASAAEGDTVYMIAGRGRRGG